MEKRVLGMIHQIDQLDQKKDTKNLLNDQV